MELDNTGVVAEFEYSAKDAAMAGLWSFFRLRGMRLLYVILTVVAIAAIVSAIRSREWGGAPLLAVLAFYCLLPTSAVVSSILNQRRMAPTRGSTRYAFASGGVQIHSGVGEATLSWQAFQKAIETAGAFYLAQQAGLWHFVPKRGFKGASDVEHARRLIGSALGKRARLRQTRRIE